MEGSVRVVVATRLVGGAVAAPRSRWESLVAVAASRLRSTLAGSEEPAAAAAMTSKTSPRWEAEDFVAEYK